MRTRAKYLTEHRDSIHLDKQTKKATGSYWTPPSLALMGAQKLGIKFPTAIFDPFVGCGNLLAAAMDIYPFLQEEDLYGMDIDPEAIRQCKELFPFGHFHVGDFFNDPIILNNPRNIETMELWDEYMGKKEAKG